MRSEKKRLQLLSFRDTKTERVWEPTFAKASIGDAGAGTLVLFSHCPRNRVKRPACVFGPLRSGPDRDRNRCQDGEFHYKIDLFLDLI